MIDRIIRLPIEGLLLIEPKVFGDERGYFFESYSERDLFEALGDVHFVQDNESLSRYGVLRGLHFQKAPYMQAKLIRVVRGTVYDVAVDIRKGSPTFGQYHGEILSAENHHQFYIPKGFAHGYSVLSDEALFQYKCDEYYHPEAEAGLAWDDPDLGIDWHLPAGDVILSEKDRRHPSLKTWTEQGQ